MKYIVLVLAFLLSGCNLLPVKKEIQTITVKVPVPTKCEIEWPERPIEYTKKVRKEDPFLIKANSVIAENEERKVYEEKLEAAVKPCVVEKSK